MERRAIAVRGQRPGDALRKPSKTYGEGRVCADQTCSTMLSQYNPQEYCNLHRKRKKPRLRGRDYDSEQQEPVPHCVPCFRSMISYGKDLVVVATAPGALTEFEFLDKIHVSGLDGAGTLCEVV